MSAKHTPGPWKAHRIEKGPGLPYTPVAAKTLLAKVYSEAFGDFEQSEANARLIAAAPDLLEALRALHSACVKDGWPVYGAHPAAMNAALAAIAKATGQKGGA